jgi:zinicin-like metallopeptidase
MRLADFEALVQRLGSEVPAEYLEGVMEIEVSRNTLPHATRADIYTLGECIPLPLDHQDSPSGVLSRIVLYYGSFQALAKLDSEFDWRGEAWETLTHELRHHLEWRARAPDLEEFDWATEQNFARQDGERFDPTFYRSGEKIAEGIYRLDDDFFLEHEGANPGSELRVEWHGRHYRVTIPAQATVPAFITLDGIEDPPPGDLILTLRPSSGVVGLFRREAPWEGRLLAKPA